MAQKVHIETISDLSQKPDADTVSFGLDGTEYVIDLTEREREQLRKALGRYIAAGRRARSKTEKRTRRFGVVGPEPAVIREWARREGHTVPAKGRIPEVVREAYAASH